MKKLAIIAAVAAAPFAASADGVDMKLMEEYNSAISAMNSDAAKSEGGTASRQEAEKIAEEIRNAPTPAAPVYPVVGEVKNFLG